MAVSDEFWSAEYTTLFHLVYPEAERLLLAGVEDGFQTLDLDLGVDWNLVNERVRQYATQYTYDLVSGITNTSRELLQDRLEAWIASGDPIDALIDTLRPWWGPVRGEMIAVTEVTRLYAEGNLYAWRQTDVVTDVRWMTVRDDAVCSICEPLHHQIAPKDTLVFPGYVGLPPAHVRCRCWILPVVNIDKWFALWQHRKAFEAGQPVKLPRFIQEQLVA